MTLKPLFPLTQQFQNKNGSNLVSGKVYIYYQGRTALATTYHDEEGTVVNSNPVLLDNNGRATVFADTIYSYTIVVCDYYGKELFSQDITLHDAISTAEDVKVIGSNGSVKVDTTTLPNGVQYDLSVNTDIIATKESVDKVKTDLNTLTGTVNNHTTQIGQIQEDINGIESTVANKKDKQAELNFNGTATKTVKKITQNANGELNVEFEDISTGTYTAGDAIDLTNNTISVKNGKGLEITTDNKLQLKVGEGLTFDNDTLEVTFKDLATSITSFRTGDVIPVDGPSGTAKMSKDDLLKVTGENALGSIHLLSDTATEADLKAGNYFALDGAEGTKRIPAEVVAKASLVENIENGEPTEDEAVVIEDDAGNEVARVDNDGFHAKKLYMGDSPFAESNNEPTEDDAVVIEDGAGNEVAKVDEKGFHAKGYFDNNGNPAIPRKIYVAPSGADFTSLTRAILAAVEVEGTEVYVGNGTYDIIEEYTEIYGQSFFENFNEQPGGNVGIKLYNSIKLFFAPRAFVVCNYTGKNNKVMNDFSPFNANPMQQKNDFEIHGLKIKASNVRYAVHDEMWSNATPYTHRYLDCDMYIDNTKSVPNPDNPSFRFVVCIGGGLGKYGKILLEGCKFETEEYKESSTTGPGVSWHNSSAAGAKSVLDVNGCYFAGGSTFKFTWYGSSEEMSIAYVRGCRIGSPLINQAENGSATIVNASIIAWNNEEV